MEHEKLTPFLPDGVEPAEADALDSTWRALGAIDAPPSDPERMRARLDAVIDAFEDARHGTPRMRPSRGITRYARQGLAAAAVLAIGIGIGWYGGTRATARSVFAGIRPAGSGGGIRTTADPVAEIAAMRSEVHDLREMVSLSLMQQQSASDRLRGVSWTGQIDRPSDEIVSALLDALMHDPNVNVRLATLDALQRYASRDDVKRGTVEAAGQQASPLVQVALIDFMVKTNEREGVATLKRLAMDPQVDSAVRARAQWGLQQLG
jgi:hypothetical protein